jgi:hypothetical protein
VREIFQRGIEAQIGLFDRHLPADARGHDDQLEHRENDHDGNEERAALFGARQGAVMVGQQEEQAEP